MLPHGPFIYDSEGNDIERDPNLAVDKEGYFGPINICRKKEFRAD